MLSESAALQPQVRYRVRHIEWTLGEDRRAGPVLMELEPDKDTLLDQTSKGSSEPSFQLGLDLELSPTCLGRLY